MTIVVNGRDSGKKQALGESKEAIVLLIRGSDEHARKCTIDLAAILTANSIKPRRIRCDKRIQDRRTITRRNFTSAMILRPAGGHDRALRKRADRSGKWTNRVPSLPPWRNQGSPFALFPSACSYHLAILFSPSTASSPASTASSLTFLPVSLPSSKNISPSDYTS